jgi:dTDP-L-rhamnose 4-epimerase
MNVLITGGAGFIGTHLMRRLLREGCTVSVLDNFSSQVHAGAQDLAPDLRGHVELLRGDVQNRELIIRAVKNQEVIVHLAAETGTGQSMYAISRYQDANIGGTATLFDVLVNHQTAHLKKIVVASSRAVYGEGKYYCERHGVVYPDARVVSDLKAGLYDPRCPFCGDLCTPTATNEDSPLNPLSFYGLTKQVQEQMVLMFARAMGLSACALRYQNVYGPGQSLNNPYTGILAIFSNLARSNAAIQIFEDGQESRDFVYVEDAVDATWRCVSSDANSVESMNVGTGQRTTVRQVAEEVVEFFGSKSKLTITGGFRQGDIRHNFADITKIQATTGFIPQFDFAKGLKLFLEWAEDQVAMPTAYESSLHELRERGLFHG